MATPEIGKWEHIGDGVYISFDGYQLWLGANKPVEQVAIEPGVFASLLRYARNINREHNVRYFDIDYKEPTK